MQISASSQTSLQNPANNLVFALYDASAPSVLLESQAPAKPYGNPLQITFLYNALAGHVYIIQLWESSNTTPTGALRNNFKMTVNGQKTTVRMPEYLTEGSTPGLTAGATSYVDTSLSGWDYTLERVGQGTMFLQGQPNVSAPDYSQQNTGGWTLLNSGDTIQIGEKFLMTFVPQVNNAVPVAGPSPAFSSGQIITIATTLTAADKSKALFLRGAAASLPITLPLLTTISDYDFFYFYSNGGSHVSAPIAAAGTDKIFFNGDKAQLILNQAEALRLFKANGKWNVDNDPKGILQVGEFVFKPKKDDLNILLCDGSEISRVTYARLWEYLQTLESGALISKSSWNTTTQVIDDVTYYTNKCKFHTGDGSTTFGLPLLFDKFIRPIDGGSRGPGSFQIDSIMDMTFNLPARSGSTSSGPGGINFPNGSDTIVKVGQPKKPNGSTMQRISTEARPINAGEYLGIRI